MPRQIIKQQLDFKTTLIDSVNALPNTVETGLVWQRILNAEKSHPREALKIAGVTALNECFNDVKVTKKALLDYLKKNIKQAMPSLWLEGANKYRPQLQTLEISRDKFPAKVATMFEGFRIDAVELPSFGYRIIKVYFDDDIGNHPRWYAFDHRWKMLFTETRTNSFKRGFEAGDEIYSRLQNKFKDMVAMGNKSSNYFERYSLFGGKNYKEWYVCAKDWPHQYIDRHFKIQNLLFHIRTSEWIDIHQQSVFLIDEIQSDWANDIRHAEYDEVIPMPHFKKWIELAVKTALTIAVRAGYQRIAFTTAKQHAKRYNRKQESFAILYDKEIPKILGKAKRTYGGELGWTTINAFDPLVTMRFTKYETWQMMDKASGKQMFNPIKNEEIGLRYLKKTAKPSLEVVRTFNITDPLALKINCNDLPLIDWSML